MKEKAVVWKLVGGVLGGAAGLVCAVALGVAGGQDGVSDEQTASLRSRL